MKLIINTVSAKINVEKIDVTEICSKPIYINGRSQISGELKFESYGDFSEYVNKKGKLKDKFYTDIMYGNIAIYKM